MATEFSGYATAISSASPGLFAGMAERDKGITHAAECRNVLVQAVRQHLEGIARERSNRCVTMDDALPFLELTGRTPRDLGNAAGIIFRYPAWECTGLTTPSVRRSSHARRLLVWRLK